MIDPTALIDFKCFILSRNRHKILPTLGFYLYDNLEKGKL